MAVIRGRTIGTPDLILTGAGAAMLIDSMLPWRGYDANGWHPPYNGFQSGFFAFIPLFILLLVAGTSATRAWTETELGRVGAGELTWNLVFLIADAAAFLLLIFR